MGNAETKECVLTIGRALGDLYDAGTPVTVSCNTRPDLRIISFEPFSCQEYGTLFNRAPRLSGRFIVYGTLTGPVVIGGVRRLQSFVVVTDGASATYYAYQLDARRLQDLANILGLEMIFRDRY